MKMYVSVLFPINAESFTYTVPEELQSSIKLGLRVRAPFKRSEKVGIVQGSEYAGTKNDWTGPRGVKKIIIKEITEVIDEEPLVTKGLLDVITWTGQYYMSSSGLALKNAVLSQLFTGKKSGKSRITYDEANISSQSIKLTSEQEGALTEINSAKKGVFLLHGVTGSGKTEVYIRAIKALPHEKQAIVLVPEIAITAQMVDRFREGFGDDAVFFHSGLSPGERLDAWWKMRRGEVKVVIGVRSAVFAPFANPGLIVIDEEQESSYKQFEGLRYSARDVALARAKIEGIKVVLGSATPSIEAFYNAKKGKFHYIELRNRIEKRPLPVVEIIDMTKEKMKTLSFSDRLLASLKKNNEKGQQSLIMLNRRGYSPFPICTDCGHTFKCPACSITLTYHKDTKTLNCHYCGNYLDPQLQCPACKGTKVKYLGAGTQKIEEEVSAIMPEVTFERMDRDTTRRKLSHYRIIKKMEEKKIAMLLGTQMIAKGHDFPDVTVSAILSSDIALNLPDFRSAERAFQLFTQMAGRAGRGAMPGKAFIQTYEPDHDVFDYVIQHDYKGFYKKEIEMRRELSYPPFSRLVRIILSFKTKDAAKKYTKLLSVRLKKDPPHTKTGGIQILGPAPAPVEKVKNLWRWHLILKGKNAKKLRQVAAGIVSRLGDIKDMKIEVDVDPINLM
jgi:primosomal protein N' (replication factor Y)